MHMKLLPNSELVVTVELYFFLVNSVGNRTGDKGKRLSSSVMGKCLTSEFSRNREQVSINHRSGSETAVNLLGKIPGCNQS